MSFLINILILCVVVLVTTGCSVRIWRNAKGFLNHVHVHVITMSFNTVAGMALGTVISMLFYYHALPSLCVGLLVGYLTGKPLGHFAILDGMTSGLMGGLMGAMVIPMIHLHDAWTILEGVFVFLMLVNYKLIGQVAVSEKNSDSKIREQV